MALLSRQISAAYNGNRVQAEKCLLISSKEMNINTSDLKNAYGLRALIDIEAIFLINRKIHVEFEMSEASTEIPIFRFKSFG